MPGLKRPILDLNFSMCLAPMVGLSHFYVRKMVQSYLPTGAKTIWPTEMLNSRRLPGQKVGETPETLRDQEETALVPQILGNEETPIRLSIEKLKLWGASGIDINMGCPVQKALKHNYGVALMGDASYAAQVTAMAVRSSTLPVSVKLRSGLSGDTDFLLDFVSGLESSGASWITLHPRMAAEKRRGEAKWDQISIVRDSLKIPVIGNGDVQTLEDAQRLWSETHCDMVMVGRALMARPWLLWQWGEFLGFSPPPGREGETAPKTPLQEGAEYGRALLFLIEKMKSNPNQNLALRQLRFFLKTGSVWLSYGHYLLALSTRAKNLEELSQYVNEFFSCPQKMHSRTQLRH